jgi:hypothetical protein
MLDDSDRDEKLDRAEVAFLRAVAKIIDECRLDAADVTHLLLGALYQYHSLGYVLSVEKPSETGLKLQLDRLRKVIDDCHRDFRKSAGETVRSMSGAMSAVIPELERAAGRDGPADTAVAGKV